MLLFKGKKEHIALNRRYDMARAKRHYIPGYIWHLTQRCHAVAIESGKHFKRCLVYMDMNMVRPEWWNIHLSGHFRIQ